MVLRQRHAQSQLIQFRCQIGLSHLFAQRSLTHIIHKRRRTAEWCLSTDRHVISSADIIYLRVAHIA